MCFVWLPKSTVMTAIVRSIKSWFFKINREILVQKFMKIILCKVKESFSLNREMFRNSFCVENCFLSFVQIAEVNDFERLFKRRNHFFWCSGVFFRKVFGGFFGLFQHEICQ